MKVMVRLLARNDSECLAESLTLDIVALRSSNLETTLTTFCIHGTDGLGAVIITTIHLLTPHLTRQEWERSSGYHVVKTSPGP